MLKLSFAIGVAITCTSAHAQNIREKLPVNATVKNGGTLDWHTGKWRRSGGSFANAPGAMTIYDNSCTWAGGGFFGAADSCETVYDEGRIPTTDSGDPINAVTSQTSDGYTFCGYNFSYCTGELSLDLNFSFYQGLVSQGVGGSCGGPYGDAFSAFCIVWWKHGVPASPNGIDQACWNVTIDLSNNANGGFPFDGNDDVAYTGVPNEDLFAWAWAPDQPTLNAANPTGLFIMGEPATAVSGGENTFDIPSATDPITGGPCGSGLDTTDNFWINTDGPGLAGTCTTPTGCYFFGGYPGNPLASWSMTMFATGDGGPPSGFTNYCIAKASSSGCLASMSGDAGPPVSGANDWNVSVSAVEGNRPGIFFSANTAQASIPFQGSGTLCMFPPLRRGVIMFSFGTPSNCDGAYTQTVNDGNLFPGGFDGGPGATTFLQAWYRDPLVLDTGTALSDAIEVTWAP